MKRKPRYCPLCGKELIIQSGKYLFGHKPKASCPEIINFQGDKQISHYISDPGLNKTQMIVMPYRIITYPHESTISVHIPPDHPKANSAYKSGIWLFKTAFHCPPIQPMEQDKLLHKIELLMAFS